MNSVDLASEWIQGFEAKYIAKDDKVVWLESVTGNPSDLTWQHMTLLQLERVISCTLGKVSQDDLIQAFQEEGEVYRLAVTSDFRVPEGIFNYNIAKSVTVAEKAVQMILIVMSELEITTRLVHVTTVVNKVCKALNTKVTSRQRNKYIRKHGLKLGYVLHENKTRVKIKYSLVTMISYKGSHELVELNKALIGNISDEVLRRIK